MSFHELAGMTRRALSGRWLGMAFKLGLLSVVLGVAHLLQGMLVSVFSTLEGFGATILALAFGLPVGVALVALETGLTAEIFLARAMNRNTAFERTLTRVGALAGLVVVGGLAFALATGGLVALIALIAAARLGVLTALGTALGVTAGVWLWLRFSFAIYWVIEGMSAGNALVSSWRFTRDERGLCLSWLVSTLAIGAAIVVSAWGLSGFFAPSPYDYGASADDLRKLVFALAAGVGGLSSLGAILFFGTAHAMIYVRLRPVSWSEAPSGRRVEPHERPTSPSTTTS